MSKVHDALMEAFAGESQANRKYLAYAKKAEAEGHPQVARLFRAVAHAETIHAHNHLRQAGEIGTTGDNLISAVAGEHYESTSMYPAFMKEAEEAGETRAYKSFHWANEAEKVHEVLYKEALDNLGNPEEAFDYYVCPVCGYTHKRSAPEKCPVCGTLGSKFERIS